MNNLRITIAGLIILFCAFSLVHAEDVTKTYNNRDFTSVSAGYGMKVTITQSDKYSVEVKSSEKIMEYLKVDQSGDELKIYIDRKSFSVRGDIYVNITMPMLTELSLSGGAIGRIKMDAGTRNFEAELSGGAQLRGNLICGDLSMELSGGSRTELNGKGKDLDISGSGGSAFLLKDFFVRNVESSLSGGSNATVSMDGELNTDQSGGSSLRYHGKAVLGRTSFSGGASAERAD